MPSLDSNHLRFEPSQTQTPNQCLPHSILHSLIHSPRTPPYTPTLPVDHKPTYLIPTTRALNCRLKPLQLESCIPYIKSFSLGIPE